MQGRAFAQPQPQAHTCLHAGAEHTRQHTLTSEVGLDTGRRGQACGTPLCSPAHCKNTHPKCTQSRAAITSNAWGPSPNQPPTQTTHARIMQGAARRSLPAAEAEGTQTHACPYAAAVGARAAPPGKLVLYMG